jgi:regulator of sigma E protease
VGFISFLRILGFISIAIALAQLLPIPILDGGQIILNLVESVRRKPLAPKFIYGFQIVGFFIILAILVTTIMSDILSFIR